MPPDLLPIQAALKADNKKTAQVLLRPLLKQPTADIWVLAAQACESREQAISCLRRALELEPLHTQANRLLFKLEGAKPLTAPPVESPPSAPTIDEADLPPLKQVKRRRDGGGARRLIIFLGMLLFGSSCSLLTLNLIGVITGPVTVLTQITGGPTPVHEVDGMPIEQVQDAPLIVPAAQSEPIAARDTDVLEPGYLHEYEFEARDGESVAVYVQFLSLGANRVSRNIALVRPNGSDATKRCERGNILQGDNNITLICDIDAGGTWKVRILGRRDESVGAYFVGVERMEG